MFKKIFLITLLLLSPYFALAQSASAISYQKAEVLEVKESAQTVGNEVVSQQKIKVKILGGAHQGDVKEIINNPSHNPLDLKIKPGDKVLLYIEEGKDGNYTAQIQSYYVLPVLLFSIALFFLLIALIGGWQGIKAILSLILSLLFILKILLPGILDGKNPILLTFLISALVTFITLLLISGWRKKTIAAILGTLSGVLVAFLFAYFFAGWARLNGLAEDQARTLFSSHPQLDFQGILLAGIIIGALGAVMDVAMSIASTVAEVQKASPQITFTRLFQAGLNVGKDVMGTMSNTLIFAYTGSSLFLLLLFDNFGQSYLNFLNFNFVAEEVIRSIAGSIGLILVIPLTAFISALIENK